ncbi:putative holin-like toxin, partial [Staphylococcus aureus]
MLSFGMFIVTFIGIV